jgi:hypothetical protein
VDSWSKSFQSNDKIRTLHVKLARLGKALRKWSQARVEERKGKIDVAQELIFQLDQAQELEEVGVRKRAKQRILAFSALRRIKIRQRSRLTWIRTGDANTKLFHLRATGRRRKNYIPVLVHHRRMAIAQ